MNIKAISKSWRANLEIIGVECEDMKEYMETYNKLERENKRICDWRII